MLLRVTRRTRLHCFGTSKQGISKLDPASARSYQPCSASLPLRRDFQTSVSQRREDGKSVPLDFESYEAPTNSSPARSTEHVVLCHGLFGSKQNWRSLAKAISQKMGLKVYALDLRNHGTSPHVDSMSYSDMAGDVSKFFQDHGIKNATLIGHSMGGKAVQSFALSPERPKDALSHLISVDMSPARGPLSNEFAQYIEAMLDVDQAKCTSRNQADDILKKTEPELGIRQFLLTNLVRAPDANRWTFRIPIGLIKKNLDQIGDFPYDPEGPEGDERPKAKWDGRTLFIKGAKSKYINRKNIPICDAFFPNARHVTLDSGHWVQAEKPREFVEELIKFVEEP